MDGAIEYGQAMFYFSNTSLPIDFVGFAVLLAAVIFHYVPDKWTFDWKSVYCRFPAAIQGGLIVTTIFLLIAISAGQAPFIYFQF